MTHGLAPAVRLDVVGVDMVSVVALVAVVVVGVEATDVVLAVVAVAPTILGYQLRPCATVPNNCSASNDHSERAPASLRERELPRSQWSIGVHKIAHDHSCPGHGRKQCQVAKHMPMFL